MICDSKGYDEALQKHEAVSHALREFVSSKGSNTAAEEKIRNSVTPGLYEHFKSAKGDPKFYVVHFVQLEVDSHIPSVAYTSLYGERAGKAASRHLTREEDGFLMPIDRAGYRGPRFKLLTPLSRREIDMLLQYVGELKVIKDLTDFRLHAGRLVKKNIPLF